MHETFSRRRRRSRWTSFLSLVTMLLGMAVATVATAAPAQASHFRFRSLTWQQVAGGTVELQMRIADRRSFYGTVNVGDPWSEFVDFGDGSSGNLQGTVVAVNPVDDWFLADMEGTHTYAGTGPYDVTWSSCCTLSSLRNSPDSSLTSRAVINLNGGNAASPRTSISPIVNVAGDEPADGTIRNIKVAAFDPDSSGLTYRLTSQAESQVTQPDGMSINSATGVLAWDVDGLQDGLWMTTVTVSDALGAETQVTFLLNLGGTGGGDPPTWTTPPTPKDRTIFKPQTSQKFEMTATDPEGQPVTITNLGLPSGVSCVDVANPAVTAVVECTVAPTTSQFDLLTFDAQDPSGNSAGLRNYTVGGGRYVALGDSFAAGEGLAPYEAGTDESGVNQCHRSAAAYPALLGATPGAPLVTESVACSGAGLGDMRNPDPSTTGAPWNEGSQFDALGQDTTLATIQAGADEIGLPHIVAKCAAGPCMQDLQASTQAAIDALDEPDGDGFTPLQYAFLDVRDLAPKARALVVGYPLLVDTSGTAASCGGMTPGDRAWLNGVVTALNAVLEANALLSGLEYVDASAAFAGHTLCDSDPYVQPKGAAGAFRPTAAGQRAIADLITAHIAAALADASFNVLPFETYESTQEIPVGSDTATFSTVWPGSDVVMTLTSPSGRVIQRSTTAPDVFHVVGPTTELYVIDGPEPGTWKISLFGADVGADGEVTDLFVNTVAAQNQLPKAAFTQSGSGSTIQLDATTSSDPDGTVASYLWLLDDGTTSTQPKLSHTYTTSGTYTPTLVVTDDDGGQSFLQGAPFAATVGQQVFTPPFNENPAPPAQPAPPASPQPSPTASGGAPAPSPSGGSSSTPAATAPVTPGTAAPTLSVSPSTIDVGQPARVTVTAAPGSTIDLLAYTRPSTTYVVVRDDLVVPANGVLTIDVRPASNTRLYAQQVGGGRSESQVVNVRQAISLSAVRNGARDYTFTGQLMPRRAGVLVSIYRVTGGGLVLTAQGVTEKDGSYRIDRSFLSPGLYEFVARTGGGLQQAAGQSKVRPTLVH